MEHEPLLDRLNTESQADTLTEQGQAVAQLLDDIAANPKLLDEDPKLKEFYDFAIKAKDGKVEGDRIIIEDKLEEVNSKIQEEFGYDTIEDLIEASKGWKKGSEQFEQWNTLLNTAPQSLSTAISLYLQGNENWNKAIALDTKIDFTQPRQSKKELIKFYFPNQFTDEEINNVDSTDDEGLKRASKLAEGFYSREHEAFVGNIKRATDNQARNINAQKQALESNKLELKKKYPTLTDAQVNKLVTSLTTGSYARHFLNKDGIFTTTAAEKLIALEMPDVYKKLIIGKTTDEVNREKMELLNRSSDHPALKGRVQNPNQKQPDQITKSLLQKKPTYRATPISNK